MTILKKKKGKGWNNSRGICNGVWVKGLSEVLPVLCIMTTMKEKEGFIILLQLLSWLFWHIHTQHPWMTETFVERGTNSTHQVQLAIDQLWNEKGPSANEMPTELFKTAREKCLSINIEED